MVWIKLGAAGAAALTRALSGENLIHLRASRIAHAKRNGFLLFHRQEYPLFVGFSLAVKGLQKNILLPKHFLLRKAVCI
ncbi:MAG TPA: hypothetical protein PLV20_04630 [Anaerolineaceae bacterium]|nr:hypothetical protein [Anaerolineaceae bacterium]